MITQLQAKYPDELPKGKDITLNEIHRLQGNLEVIKYIEAYASFKNKDFVKKAK